MKFFRGVIFGVIIVLMSILIAIVFFNIVYAADLSFEYIRQSPKSENFGNSDGVKIIVIPDDWSVFAWGSAERARFSLSGQNFDYVNFFGIGIGVKHKFSKSPLSIFFDAGWFQPFHENNGDHLKAVPGDKGDRCDIYLNERYAQVYGRHEFDYYTMKQSGNFGASIGIKYRYNRWIIGMGYRLLEIPLMVEGKSLTDEKYAWSRYEDQKLSGPIFSVGYVF